MLSYSEVKPKMFIALDGEPYEVLTSSIVKKQRQKPVNQTKLRHMISGNITERAFHQSDKIDTADIDNKKILYLYNNHGEFWFSEIDNPKERFSLKKDVVGIRGKFLKEKTSVEALMFGGNIIGITIPIKVELKVTDAPPAVRGNTAQGGTKQITLENGISVNAPLFINEGDTVCINTETSEYVERVEKK
ncbi:elongation factor P [Patescibacteria group bacterium]|nr:elongation factor P [Patescibacteria group bacterium]